MADPGTYPDYATNTNYATGPDAGSANKEALSLTDVQDGNIRGAGHAPSEKKFNYWMNLVGLWIRRLAETATTALAGRVLLSSGSPSALGVASAGTADGTVANADHVHAHGDLAGGSLHSTAVAGVSDGFISAANQAKLDGLSNDMTYTTATSSRNIAAGDCYKTLKVDSSSGAVVITFTKDATLDLNVGANGLIRWTAGANQVSVAAEDGTVTVDSSGTELKISRVLAQIYWEKTASNSYFISGEKTA
jgi:hypothetical protein